MSWVEDCTSHLEKFRLLAPAVYYSVRFVSNEIFAGEGRRVQAEVHALLGNVFVKN